MQLGKRRRATMDVFGGVEEARPEDLQAARVNANVGDREHIKTAKKSKVKVISQQSDRILEKEPNGPTLSAPHLTCPRPRLRSPNPSLTHDDKLDGEDIFVFPEEGSYLCEVEDGIMTPLLYESNDFSSDPDDVPVRILDQFLVFDPSLPELVSLSSLWKGDGPYEAFGWAIAEPDEEQQDDRFSESDGGIFFRTSTILTGAMDIQQDSIWIKTQYAWYVLRTPAETYRPLFVPFYMKEMVLRLVLRGIVEEPSITKETTLQRLASRSAIDPILGRCWNSEDISMCQYTVRELVEVIAAIPGVDWNSVKHSPSISILIKSTHGSEYIQKADGYASPSAQITAPAPVPPRKRAARAKSGPISVTLLIYTLVSPWFGTFKLVGNRPRYLDEEMLARDQPRIEIASEEVRYKPGDFVIVSQGDIEDESNFRFAQFLFYDLRKKNAHVRWFIHGSKTLLEDFAHGQELFLSIADGCETIPIDCMVSKCDVQRISLADYAQQKWPGKNSYFYSSSWDRKYPAQFVQVQDEQVQIAAFRACSTCQARDQPVSEFLSISKSIIRSEEYHKHDFIRYVSDTSLTCSIGQIIAFHCFEDEVRVKVCKLGRARDRNEPGLKADEKELFVTPIQETVTAISVLGPCQVVHISDYELESSTWLHKHPDCLYVVSRAASLNSSLTPLPQLDLQLCQLCHRRAKDQYELKSQCESAEKLCAFDPFIGVGGLGLGLADGCSMQTCLGVEIDPNAAETTRRNFPPDTTILTADANKVLHDVARGREPKLTCKKINLIYSGPPCQNDSTLNRHKTDEKQPALTLLSFVDLLRPKIFIMESVPGFLHWKILAGTPKEIKAGNLKLVLKILHFLGYNIMGRMMHARSFGVPQTRDRFFIVATLPALGPFQWPEPTHAFDAQYQPKARGYTLGPGLSLKSAVAPGRALHAVVTVAEALSDLPLFEWKSPKKLTQEEEEEAEGRAKFIPTLPCHPDEVWGIEDEDFQYLTPPTNAYQQRARRDLVLSEETSYQYITKHFPISQVQNICDIPFARGADYRHLDQKDREWCLRDPASAKSILGYRSGAYNRLDPNGYFDTITTQIGPVAKQSKILHPFCKRILTVRELARAQGFPDNFVFYSARNNPNDYHNQIGNSVPFAVSAALGRSVQDLVFKQWMQSIGNTN